MADVSLLADIIICKYLYHLPFYRVIETYKELGVTISASTINDLFKAVVGKVKLLLGCWAHGVDERTWMEDVLRRIPEYELGQKDFSDLLPGNWTASVGKKFSLHE